MNGYLKFIGTGGKANYEFVGMTEDGKIIQTDEATITYNNQNLMESFEKNIDEKYHFYYDYQGIRYKK